MTREEWLNKALLLLKRSLFKDAKTPDNIKVSCGLPSKRAFAAKKRVVGQCWSPDSTSDKSIQIFISPTLSEPFKVIDTLAHEMIHAIVGNDQGHKGAFKQMALKVGFTGKMTETIPGAALSDRFKLLVGQLGDYPHAELKSVPKLKKCGTRMIKLECDSCGYIVRTTQKWIDLGTPTCTCGGMFK